MTQESFSDTFTRNWKLFDQEDSGTITTSEFPIVLRSCHLAPTQNQLDQLLKSLDADDSGFVHFSPCLGEVQKVLEKMKPDEKELKKALKVFDKDGNEKLSLQEMRSLLLTLGDKLTEEEFTALMKNIPKDGNVLDASKFAEHLLS